MAHIHRFRSAVALSLDDGGGTVYLRPAHAEALAYALLEYAADCRSHRFMDSPLGTWQEAGEVDEYSQLGYGKD